MQREIYRKNRFLEMDKKLSMIACQEKILTFDNPANPLLTTIRENLVCCRNVPTYLHLASQGSKIDTCVHHYTSTER